MMWKEKYRIGAELVDTQHQELFQRVSTFVATIRSPEPWEQKLEQVQKTLEFMQDYVVTHFHEEEVYQEQINFPLLERHKILHENFKARVQDYATRVEQEGYNEELVQEFAGKLMTWLIMHVTAEDQKIGDYLRSLGGTI